MDSCLCGLKQYECGLRIYVKCLLCVDDKVILAPSMCELQEMVNKVNDSVNKKGIKINVSKTNVMMFERGESTTECNILIDGEKVKQMKEFVYLGSQFTNDGKHDKDIKRRVNAGSKLNGALLAIMNSKSVSR
ncbi:hypothetical protein EVAR_95036_1 [Eumeta japonica]|uniref:Reverse transcriptase domain-containing protein n=1 Tax=Eumeta variegata TaxID=151549 RepID=A0A4C1VW11_EUMVA|nr:hypothetical protein EVAR_95036_1 [Eumeta japonica]